MAGDVSYLRVCNEGKQVLDEKYIGKLRYQNMFSMENYKYCGFRNEDMYALEARMSDGRTSYCIWDEKTIGEIRTILSNCSPVARLEEEAYDDSRYALDWIDEMLIKYQEQLIHFVFVTDHDC